MKYSTSRPKMLLHVCCANCAGHPVELFGSQFDMTMFFYNPNIHPPEEYRERLHDVRKLSEKTNIPLITGEYDPHTWFDSVKGLEDEPEGGRRCSVCFDIRLEKTALQARQQKMDIFATTLSISPHKDARAINRAGSSISERLGIYYHAADLKKKDGFRKAAAVSRSYGFYRQDYCGCIYSIRK